MALTDEARAALDIFWLGLARGGVAAPRSDLPEELDQEAGRLARLFLLHPCPAPTRARAHDIGLVGKRGNQRSTGLATAPVDVRLSCA